MAPSAGSDSPKAYQEWRLAVIRVAVAVASRRVARAQCAATQRRQGRSHHRRRREDEKVSELAAQENVSWLMPPARRFYGVMICLFAGESRHCGGRPLAGISRTWACCPLGRGGLGGIVLVMMVLPRNWQRAGVWRSLPGMNAISICSMAAKTGPWRCPAVLVGMEQDRKVGHDGQWLDFSLDLGLDEVTLATATSLPGLSREGDSRRSGPNLSIRVQTPGMGVVPSAHCWPNCTRSDYFLDNSSQCSDTASDSDLIFSCSDSPKRSGLGIRSWKCHGMMPWLVRQGVVPLLPRSVDA